MREVLKIILEKSLTILHRAVTVILGYCKSCTYWVPKMLTEEPKENYGLCSTHLFTHYAETGDGSVNHIVTGDEMWFG